MNLLSPDFIRFYIGLIIIVLCSATCSFIMIPKVSARLAFPLGQIVPMSLAIYLQYPIFIEPGIIRPFPICVLLALLLEAIFYAFKVPRLNYNRFQKWRQW